MLVIQGGWFDVYSIMDVFLNYNITNLNIINFKSKRLQCKRQMLAFSKTKSGNQSLVGASFSRVYK